VNPPKKAPKPEPTQTTEKGLEIPFPTREEYLRNLARVAPKPKPDQDAEEK